MSPSYQFDVAIVGGGLAGLMSGLRLAEAGLRVGILEQGESERYLCNTRFTGGIFHVCYHPVDADESVLAHAINEHTDGFASSELAAAVAKDTRHAVQWLKAKGIKFIKGGTDAWRKNTLAPPALPRPGLHWEGRGGDVLMRTLTATLKQLHGTLLLDARALKLHMDRRRCTGVDIEERGKRTAVLAKNVVICDGGFQANHALLREFITPAPEKLKQRGAATSNGDGLCMARDVGAQIVGLDNFYGHLLCQNAMHNDTLWPYPMLDYLCLASIVINATGRRFVDEGQGGIYIANCIARLDDPLSSAVIYDEAIWTGPAREYTVPANPNLVIAGGTILKASDLDGLARQLGVPGDILAETVAQYNAAIDAAQGERLEPSRTSALRPAHPIRKAPFYAVRLCAGITFTMGGFLIDGDGRVLDEQSLPIPGLYSAGCATGGLEGGKFAGYVGGLSKSAVTALRAANHIARNNNG